MTRLPLTTALLLVLLDPAGFATPAVAGPAVALVDGTGRELALLVRVDGDTAVLRTIRLENGDDVVVPEDAEAVRVPVRSLVSATLTATEEPQSDDPFNLYAAGGDRLRGAVEGLRTEAGASLVALTSKAIKGLQLPLAEVEAVCLGTFFGQVQTDYRTLFEAQRREGRDSIVVDRGSKPFSFRANVIEVKKDALDVRMGEQTRELARDKVFGFVRQGAERRAAPEGAVLVRVYLSDGGRITLPLESIDEKVIRAGGAEIHREYVTRIEFGGSHVAHLSGMEPVSVEEVALFGKAPPWRRDAMVLGGPLRLNGTTYERGLGVQAKSKLEFALGGRWNRLFVRCGIDDAASREGQAQFRVVGDGKVLAEVSKRKGEEPAVLQVDVTGVDRLVLEALPGESYTSDLCDWAEARVYVRKGDDG